MSGILNLIAAVVCLGLVPVLWHVRRRWLPPFPKHRCRNCGYDLRTPDESILPSCSECGYEQKIGPGSIEVKRIYARLLLPLAMIVLIIFASNRAMSSPVRTLIEDRIAAYLIARMPDNQLVDRYFLIVRGRFSYEKLSEELIDRFENLDPSSARAAELRSRFLQSLLDPAASYDMRRWARQHESQRILAWFEKGLISTEQFSTLVFHTTQFDLDFEIVDETSPIGDPLREWTLSLKLQTAMMPYPTWCVFAEEAHVTVLESDGTPIPFTWDRARSVTELMSQSSWNPMLYHGGYWIRYAEQPVTLPDGHEYRISSYGATVSVYHEDDTEFGVPVLGAEPMIRYKLPDRRSATLGSDRINNEEVNSIVWVR